MPKKQVKQESSSSEPEPSDDELMMAEYGEEEQFENGESELDLDE
jgi:hypothetical protein